MESKVIGLYPYEQVDISRFQRTFRPNQEKLEAELQRVLNQKSTWETAAVVELGDVVSCRIQSKIKKYNRDSIKMTIGLGLFDRELEQQLVGCARGSRIKTERQGNPVEAEVQEIRRKLTPPLEDSLIRELKIPGANTVEDYRQQLTEQQKQEELQKELYEVISYLLNQVLEHSQIETAAREYELYVEGQLARLRFLAAREGMKLEEMTPEEFEGRIPVRSYEELNRLVRQDAHREVRIALAGDYEARRQGHEIGDLEYEDYIRRGSAEMKVGEEEYRRGFPKEYTKLLLASNFYYDQLTQYVEKHLFL